MATDMETPRIKNRNRPSWLWVLAGVAIALTLTWLILTPRGILGKADAVGYSVCHQIESRSFSINGRPFPLCARCSGLFLGAVLGLVYQTVQGRKGRMPPLGASLFFGALAFAWVFDGTNSFLMFVPSINTFYETQNWTRLVTGTGMGLAVSAILRPAFIQTMYRHWEDNSALGNWKQIIGLVFAAGVLNALILLEIHWILFPLALLGAGGVLALLMIIYSMVLVMAFKRDNTFERFDQLLQPLLGGYMIALLQIGVIDLGRYLLTGTWGGFSF
jgi:uncharacterized membrane protein